MVLFSLLDGLKQDWPSNRPVLVQVGSMGTESDVTRSTDAATRPNAWWWHRVAPEAVGMWLGPLTAGILQSDPVW